MCVCGGGGVSVYNGGYVFVNYMYLDCSFIPAHVFMYVLVFLLKDCNVVSLYYEIIKFA